MTQPIKYAHARPALVSADRGEFRRLHVQELITGVTSAVPPDPTFNSVAVTTTLSFGGATTTAGPITTSDDIFCRNLTASQTISGAALTVATVTRS